MSREGTTVMIESRSSNPRLAIMAICLSLFACSSTSNDAAAIPSSGPRIVASAQSLQCVPYARQVTGMQLRGDAWTWWRLAKGNYSRDRRPSVGSILVLKKTNRLRRGHIAVVSEVLSDRTILVEHANWLNRGKIHKDIPVKDVSSNNDWSQVRVWYVPSQTLGKRTYPAHGFIHPNRRVAQLEPAAELAAPGRRESLQVSLALRGSAQRRQTAPRRIEPLSDPAPTAAAKPLLVSLSTKSTVGYHGRNHGAGTRR